MRKIMVTLIALLLVAVSASAVLAYTGTLTTSNGLDGQGIWIDDPLNAQKYPDWYPATISWTVNLTQPGVWHYDYTIQVYKGGVSHFILEMSPNFTMENIWNADGNFNGMFLDDHGTSPNNPGIPGTIHGIKFDNTWGETFTISFDSDRMPVWGDFYAKDGVTSGVTNAIWNTGLTNPDTDPVVPASDGVVSGHILVPDSVVPEPSGILALASGGLGLAGLVIRRKR